MSKMFARSSLPRASVSRSASPSRNWTGWGCPSLIAMLDAYRYVRSSVSRIGFSVPSIPGSSPTASEKMAEPPPGRAGRSRARACSAGLQFSRTVASSPSRAANTVIGRCVAYNCTRASPPSSVLALTQVLLGNSTRSSTPDAGLPALRVMITVSAGVTSVAAAGIVSRSSVSSISSRSGSLPLNFSVSLQMIGMPSPLLSMKWSRSRDPEMLPTDIRPRTEASASFRVDWRVAMFSTVMPFGRAPGELISIRSANIDSRMRLPRME